MSDVIRFGNVMDKRTVLAVPVASCRPEDECPEGWGMEFFEDMKVRHREIRIGEDRMRERAADWIAERF